MKKIYLAGKVGGLKWDVAEHFANAIEFVATDVSQRSHEFVERKGHDEKEPHESGEGCVYGGFMDRLYSDSGHHNEKEQTAIRFVNMIRDCCGLVAILDRHDSFGSIAEIAYASALRKRCEVFVCLGDQDDVMADVYWFVCTFPFVNVQEYQSLDDLSLQLQQRCEVFGWLANCESPMEQKFFDAARNRLPLVCQHPIGPYFADFAILESKVAIEIDGHEYHKTKEQRTNDAKRERWIEREGWRVVRFTGSEVFKDVNRCVREVEAVVQQLSPAVMSAP